MSSNNYNDAPTGWEAAPGTDRHELHDNVDSHQKRVEQQDKDHDMRILPAHHTAEKQEYQAGLDDTESVPSPVGDLSRYRAGMDTPSQALWGPNGIFNQVTSICVNFGVNFGAVYASSNSDDWVGVWSTPPTPKPYGLQVWSDYLLTAILVTAGMGLLATPGQWASIWIGLARPIPGKYIRGPQAHWYFRTSIGAHTPAGAKNFLVRTVLLVLQFSAPYYGILMLIFFGMCKSKNIFAGPGESVGADPGRGKDPQCWIDPLIYNGTRAAVFTVFGAYVYPIAYCAALDVDNVPAWALNPWKVAMEKKGIAKPLAGEQPRSPDSATQTQSRHV